MGYLEGCQEKSSQLMKDNCYTTRTASGRWTSGLPDRLWGTGICHASYSWEDIFMGVLSWGQRL